MCPPLFYKRKSEDTYKTTAHFKMSVKIILSKSQEIFQRIKTYEDGKCYKMEVKNRGENVILEISKAL